MEWNGRRIVVADFPEPLDARIHGAVTETDTKYLVFINPACVGIVQRYALGHELAHIYLNHFYQLERDVMDCEREANRRAWEFYRAYRDGKLPVQPRPIGT